jgi:hypothetical protein
MLAGQEAGRLPQVQGHPVEHVVVLVVHVAAQA